MSRKSSIPFRGGAITAIEKPLITSGGFSMVQNIRNRHPGFEQRKGQIKHHSDDDGSTTNTLFQFSKGGRTERRLYRQMADGSLQEATDNPPSTTTGAYGSDVLALEANSLPATYAVLNDAMIFSDGARPHQAYHGSSFPISAFILYKGGATIPAIPEIGEDYTEEVTDSRNSKFAQIGSLSTLAAFDAIYIMTPLPIQAINFIFRVANATTSVLQAEYWKGSWASVSGFSDGTASGGASMAQDGAVTWTAPTDELPHYQFGRSGFWYRLSLSSGAMGSNVRVRETTFDGTWQDIVNVWNGVLEPAIEAQVYDNSKAEYRTYGSSSVTLNKMATADFCYFSSVDPLAGLYLDPGAVPNVIDAEVIGASNVLFVNTGAGVSMDYMRSQDAKFISAGFEIGQTINISGTSSNNGDYQVLNVSDNTIWVESGSLADEAGVSATIQFKNGPNTTALDKVEVWTGNSWQTLTSLTDGTKGLTQPGFVTWDRTSKEPQPTQFNTSRYYAYWYRISFDKELSNSINISIETMPYFDVSELGLGICNGVWKGRALYSSDKAPNFILASAQNQMFHLNGEDFGILEAGDGRRNKVRVVKKFNNELIAWQEEKGEAGGCTTLFEGFSPLTFGRLLLSDRIGIMNGKCAVVVDGVITSTKTDESIKTLAFWLSRYGVMATDGLTITAISDDIQNYFDPSKPEYIRRGYEDDMWLSYDSHDNVLRIGLVSGSSATVPNVFPVLDLIDKTWSFDTHGQALSSFAEVEASSGDRTVLQVSGGASDGFVYQANLTDDDVSTAIDARIDQEIDGTGNETRLNEVVLRTKVQATGDVDLQFFADGNTTAVANKDKSLPLQAKIPGDSFRRNLHNGIDIKENHITVRLQNDTLNQSLYLEDVGYDAEGSSDRE